MSVEELVYKLRTHSDPYQTMVEAADKLEELAAALRIAQGNTDAAIEDYNEAQTALAEAKRENEALQKQVMMLGVQLDDMMFLSVEGFLDWQREQREARNAGGNDAE